MFLIFNFFFEDINNDVEGWFDTSNYDKNDKRPLQIGVNKKVIGMFKDELGGNIMKEFCALRAKTYAYLMKDDNETKKAKGVKRCVIKRRLMFEYYKESLFNNKTIMRSQLRFKSEAFIECSDTMDDVYDNINDYNSNRTRKILIVFDDMIADIMVNKKFQAIIKELFIRCRKLNVSLVLITQSDFFVPKDVRLNLTRYLIMKVNNKRELQNIAINHSADIGHEDFMKIYRECTKKRFNFLTIDTTLPASDPLRFRKNLLDCYVSV